MRLLTSKYTGQCARCAKPYEVGTQIMYERPTGCFCVGCEPREPDDVRAFRQARIDRKNDRREEWAQARERRAAAAQRRSDVLMGRDRSPPDGRADWALVTQPGYIPQRAQANRAQERAWSEQAAANEHRARKIGPAVVAGDRERRRQAHRDAVRDLVAQHVGKMISCHPYGTVTLLRVNQKSATVRTASGFTDRVCLTWITVPASHAAQETP